MAANVGGFQELLTSAATTDLPLSKGATPHCWGGWQISPGGKPEEMRWSRCTHQAVQVRITGGRLIAIFKATVK